MQIATARRTAKTYLGSHLLESKARRPDKDAKVYCRYPARDGQIITAPDVDSLQEKLAKKIQRKARAAESKH